MRAAPLDFIPGNVLERGKDEIIRGALESAYAATARGIPLSDVVQKRFGLSETHADQLCFAYGFNPDAFKE